MATDPATSTWLATVASRVAASLATKVLGASARRVQRAFADSDKQKALEQCLAGGLAALVEHSYTGDVDEHRDHIEHVLTDFAAEEDAQDALEELLAAILASGATPPDPTPLREVFGELYQPETLPDFDPDRGFAAFVEAFAAQARQEQALQESIRTERLDELVKLAKHHVKAIEDLPGRIVEEQEKAELRRIETTRDAARRRYLEHMRQRWRALPLAALGGTEGAGEEVTLDRVFIALDTLTPIGKTPAIRERRRKHPRAAALPGTLRRMTALEAVTENERLVILGDPGAGKSAFSQELLARLASAQLGEEVRLPEDLPLDLLPVFVRLRDLSRRFGGLEPEAPDQEARWRVLAQAVREQVVQNLTEEDLEACTDLAREAWRTGKCFLVLDGLDEVPESRRGLVREAVTAVRRQTRMERILVTCRVRSYQGEARLPAFEAHTLAPLDGEKIETFCQAWYRAQFALGRVSAADAEEKAGDFTRAALGEDILPLARNPMLLTTMALIHQKEVGLPRERARLYDKGVEILLTRWQQGKDQRLVEDEELAEALKDEANLRRLLERLAFEAHKVGGTQQEQAAGLPRGEILVLLAQKEYLGDAGLADRFLDYVDQRAGILVGQGGEPGHPISYSFPHRTFQEYLAGCYVVGLRGRGRRYFELAGEGDSWSVAALLGAEELLFVRRGINDVMDLVYALAGDGEPRGAQQSRSLLWAGQIAGLVGSGSFERDRGLPGKEGFLDRLRLELVALLGSDLPTPERAEVGRVLGQIGDPREEIMTCDGMEFCWVPPGEFMFGASQQESLSAFDLPQMEIALDYGYWISRMPVTHSQFRTFETGMPELHGEPFDLLNHPVIGVNWFEARAFARWLSLRWRDAGWLPFGFKVDLPTEREWEKASRGGKQIPKTPVISRPREALTQPHCELRPNPQPSRLYPWGYEPPDADRANFQDANVGATNTPGCFQKSISPVGCEETSGNVWELCISDLPRDNSPPVVRGGAFNNSSQSIRTTSRSSPGPSARSRYTGFRVVVRPPFPGLLR